jgi:hypothetical protein
MKIDQVNYYILTGKLTALFHFTAHSLLFAAGIFMTAKT